MIDKNLLNPEERAMADVLEASAQQANVDSAFKAELENKLMTAHKPKMGFGLFSIKKTASTLSWTVGLAVMALIFIWAIRSIVPQPQPAAETTSSFCPVTPPNGSLPPGETVESPEYLGNGQLWTVLWPDGKVYMTPVNQEADGSFSMKWGWFRGVTGPLTIEGHRLDAEAPPLRADIPDGYGDTGFQVSALIFPTTGCWEVTGHVGDASLTFVTKVIFEDVVPTPKPTATMEDTPIPPTSTFEVLPTAPSTLFRDDFEGSLDENWQWTHENNEHWNLTNNNGWLEIMVSYGIINNSNMDNLLLRQAPTGNFELETRLKFAPTEVSQMAGLLIYENNSNYVELVHGKCLTPVCLGDEFYFDQMTRGRFIDENFTTTDFNTDTVYLRLRFEGDSFIAYASENGTEWKRIGTHPNKIQPLLIGLFAGGSFDRSAINPAQFDYFVINALP